MLKIAITGNIAAGKSTVEKTISEMGFMVVDTDKIAHNLLESDISTRNEIKSLFKDYNILDSEGNISRKKIGEIIFKNTEYKTRLEKIIHPKVKIELQKIYKKNPAEKIIFAAVPLLFEAKFENDFDKIILVAADENIRESRLIKRNNYSIEHAKARIKSQIHQDEKILKSDFIIYNNANISSLKKSTQEVVTKIKNSIL